MSDIRDRMAELMEPIDRQIMMCDNREDVLMLACAMLTSARVIFDQELGKKARIQLFKDYIDDRN
jgi:hypothetical protein